MQTITRTARVATRVLVNLLLVAVVVGAAGFVLTGLLGYERYVITSGSMTGTYDVGSIVLDKRVPVSELAVDDVITYQPPPDSGIDHLVTHRIVTVQQPKDGGAVSYVTKGDANPQRDPWQFHLVGGVQPKVELSVPFAGYLFLALADRHTRMLVIGVPAGLLALYSLVELTKALRPRRPQSPPAQPLGV